MKLEEKIRAIALRKRGASYQNILNEVAVSKSTLSMWLREVDLSSFQKNKILKGREISRYLAAQSKKRQRIEKTEQIASQARKEFPSLLKSPLFLTGLSLYWAEGDKHRQERVKFTNSDEKMISLMMRWFREVCRVPEHKFRIALHVHNLHSLPEVQNHWAQVTGVSKKQFQKIYIKKSTLSYRRNILYAGTCAIVVNSKDLFRKIMGWRKGMVDYFGIIEHNTTA